MVTVPDINCPDVFIGEVREKIEPLGAIDPFSVEKVIFSVDEIEKGKDEDIKKVDNLIYGSLKLDIGHRYKVHLRSGKICSVEEV